MNKDIYDDTRSVSYKDMPIPGYAYEEEERRRRMYPQIGDTERYILELDKKVQHMTYRLEHIEKTLIIEREARGKAEKVMLEMTKLLKESNEALAAYRKAFEE